MRVRFSSFMGSSRAIPDFGISIDSSLHNTGHWPHDSDAVHRHIQPRGADTFGDWGKWRMQTMVKRTPSMALCCILTAASMIAATPVLAGSEAYPNRALKIVVPVPPGPMLDVLPRIVAEKLAARWGKPVVIENRPGAAQNLGAEAVARADPDGYTLLASPPGPLVVSQHLFAKLGFDPSAFVPVTVMVTLPTVVVVKPNIPVSSLSELFAYAKANPDKITY